MSKRQNGLLLVSIILWLVGQATNAYARGGYGSSSHMSFWQFLGVILFALVGGVIFGRSRR
jgi:hypothetical protein